MKLYATVTSERASKGQGGNEYLNIEIKAEGFEGIPTRANLYRISLSKNDSYGGLYAEILKYSNHEIIVLDNIKGKIINAQSPFEPRCTHCKSTMTAVVEDEEWVCDNDSCGWNLVKGSANDCRSDCKHEHLCIGVNCKVNNPHDCK